MKSTILPAATPPTPSLFDKHRGRLDTATGACLTRGSWTAFSDDPSTHPGGGRAREAAAAWFERQCGQPLVLDHPGDYRVQLDERSPYTQEQLGISYPNADVDTLFGVAEAAWPSWRSATHAARIGVCLEICAQLYEHGFELAQAAMHTTGQSFGMSFAGSGTNAIDRGIEAIAQAHLAISRVTPAAGWSRDFGSTTVQLDKRYRLVPIGVAVVIACASFPAWNAYPALFANLATGNPVVVKPHPTSVLQMALAVRIARGVLAEAGFDPNLVCLCVDTVADPIAKDLLERPATKIVDFTGSAVFGSWIETHVRHARVYTETSGVNAIVVHSVAELAPTLRAIAGSLCLFSAQMCTTPQNIYIPRWGVQTAAGVVSAAGFTAALAEAIASISSVPKRAAAVMGAVQSQHTLDFVRRMRDTVAARGTVVLEPTAYEHPGYPQARTVGPLVGLLDIADHDLYANEHFGPVAFVITADDAWAALDRAAIDAHEAGAITAFVYSTDDDFVERAEELFAISGASLSVNITGPMPLNFSAAYSDYHVTGLNPAGTATLSDESFIAGRFRIAQSRRPHRSARAEEAQ